MNAEAPLVLAVPSKGRLQENASAFFARAGLEFQQGRGARDYRGSIADMPGVDVAFLSASEIVGQLASGSAHFGVTGEDLVREQVPDADSRMTLLAPLGFGRANVVVAAPQAWIDVRTMADLEDVAANYRHRRGERRDFRSHRTAGAGSESRGPRGRSGRCPWPPRPRASPTAGGSGHGRVRRDR